MTASGVAVNHTYKKPGNYILTLTVSSPEGKRSIRKFLNVGIEPNIYDNPYSPLRGVNVPNPTVKVPMANNNLPVQPPLKSLLLTTPTSTPRETTETVASPVTTPLVRMTPTASIGTSKFPLLLGLGLAIVILSLVTLLVAGIVRRRG
jgi:PKD repeat protein